MSRSRKKFPVYTDNSDAGEKKSWKKLFNRRLRKISDIPDGGSFKKYNNSWDICDYKFLPNYSDAKDVRKAGMK